MSVPLTQVREAGHRRMHSDPFFSTGGKILPSCNNPQGRVQIVNDLAHILTDKQDCPRGKKNSNQGSKKKLFFKNNTTTDFETNEFKGN